MVSDDVTQNLMGQRMHVDGPQISEMNLYNNSFQEIGICCGQKFTVWKENLFRPKNTSKWPILVCMNLGYLTLEGSGRLVSCPTR